MKRLIFLLPLAFMSCDNRPRSSPAECVYGFAKNFAGDVHAGNRYTVPTGLGFMVDIVGGQGMCTIWHGGELEIMAVEDRLAKVRYEKHAGRIEDECRHGQVVTVSIFDIANMGITYEERDAARRKLEQTPPSR